MNINPLFLPKSAPALLKVSLDPLREQAFATWVKQHRHTVTTLLTLAVKQHWITEQDVATALNSNQRYTQLSHLLVETLDYIPSWLATVTRKHILYPSNSPHWNPLASLELDDDDTAPTGALSLRMRSLWHHSFELDHLPPAVAKTIALTLDVIADRLAQACFCRDLKSMWMDEAEMIYEQFKATGLTNLDALWDHAQHDPEISSWLEWGDQDEFEAWWKDMQSYVEPAQWVQRWLKQRYRVLNNPDRWLAVCLRHLWRWRQHPTIKQSPWFAWLRQAVLTLRRCSRRWDNEQLKSLNIESDYDEIEPLFHAQPISFNEAWERDFLEDFYYDRANADVDFCWRLRCDTLAIEPLRDTLEAFATGQGLLVGAIQANELESTSYENC